MNSLARSGPDKIRTAVTVEKSGIYRPRKCRAVKLHTKIIQRLVAFLGFLPGRAEIALAGFDKIVRAFLLFLFSFAMNLTFLSRWSVAIVPSYPFPVCLNDPICAMVVLLRWRLINFDKVSERDLG